MTENAESCRSLSLKPIPMTRQQSAVLLALVSVGDSVKM